MAIINYLLRRAIRHWQLFLNLSLGIVLAMALLASAPLLVDTVLEIGLRHEILAANAFDRNLHLQTYALTEAPIVEELDSQARYWLEKWVGDYLERTILSVDSTWMIPWVGGEPLLSDRINLSFHDSIKGPGACRRDVCFALGLFTSGYHTSRDCMASRPSPFWGLPPSLPGRASNQRRLQRVGLIGVIIAKETSYENTNRGTAIFSPSPSL